MSGDDKSIRIVFLNHWAAECGGAEMSLLDILHAIERRAQAYLLTSEKGTLLERLEGTGVARIVVPCLSDVKRLHRDCTIWSLARKWRLIIAFIGYAAKLFKCVKRIDPDVVYANVPKSHIALFLMRFFGYRGRGIVHMREIFPKRSIASLLYALLFPLSGMRVIAVSLAVKNRLPVSMRHKASVIYNGVTIPATVAAKTPLSPVRFLYLGRIVPWKGCHQIIDAFSRLVKMCANRAATLCLTGATSYWDVSYRDQLRGQIAAYGLEESITLREKSDDPYAVLCSHHVLCMASRCEPFGRVAAEAQACGLAVIGFSGGGLCEIIVHNEGGILVDYGDIDAMAAAMETFVREPQRIAIMGGRGRERAMRLFDVSSQVPLIIDSIMNGNS